ADRDSSADPCRPRRLLPIGDRQRARRRGQRGAGAGLQGARGPHPREAGVADRRRGRRRCLRVRSGCTGAPVPADGVPPPAAAGRGGPGQPGAAWSLGVLPHRRGHAAGRRGGCHAGPVRHPRAV
ncbi:MAG: hypothetical protein AVDCRST_MAG61-1591, partial [uncultured Friedmanniella sp.]